MGNGHSTHREATKHQVKDHFEKHTVTYVLGNPETQTATFTQYLDNPELNLMPRRSIDKRSDVTLKLLQDLENLCKDISLSDDEDSSGGDDLELGERSVKSRDHHPKLSGESLAKYFGHEWTEGDNDEDKVLWDRIANDVYNWACSERVADDLEPDTIGTKGPTSVSGLTITGQSKVTGTAIRYYNSTDTSSSKHTGRLGETPSATETAAIAKHSSNREDNNNVAAGGMGNIPLGLIVLFLLATLGP